MFLLDRLMNETTRFQDVQDKNGQVNIAMEHQMHRIVEDMLMVYLPLLPTWRIIPVSKWLVSPIYKPWNAHLEGE